MRRKFGAAALEMDASDGSGSTRWHDIVADKRKGCAHQRGVAAGGGGAGGVAVRGADICDLLGHLGRGKAVSEGAAVLARGGSQPLAPPALDRIDREAGGPAGAEHVAGAEPCGAERRVGLAGEALQPAVDDVVADLAQQIFAPLRHAVALIQPRPVARDSDAFGEGGIEIDPGAIPIGSGDRAGARLGRPRGGLPVSKMAADRGRGRGKLEKPQENNGGFRRELRERAERRRDARPAISCSASRPSGLLPWRRSAMRRCRSGAAGGRARRGW